MNTHQRSSLRTFPLRNGTPFFLEQPVSLRWWIALFNTAMSWISTQTHGEKNKLASSVRQTPSEKERGLQKGDHDLNRQNYPEIDRRLHVAKYHHKDPRLAHHVLIWI